MPPRALTALLPSPLMSNVSIGCRIGGQAGAGNVVHNFQPWKRKQKLSLASVMGAMQLMGKAIKRGKSQAGRQCLVNLACLGLGT